MSEDNCKALVQDFLRSSMSPVKVLVKKLSTFKLETHGRQVTLFRYVDGKKVSEQFTGNNFFLRSSVEYTNPHLTVEEVQGLIGTRLLEATANYFNKVGLREPDGGDVVQLCELLKKTPQGCIVPFLLNTDDVEADRYSMNPLKQSIVDSGQSAFPAAFIKTDSLKIDEAYAKKYDGSLISKGETELISSCLKASNGSYLDFVDSVKYSNLSHYPSFSA